MAINIYVRDYSYAYLKANGSYVGFSGGSPLPLIVTDENQNHPVEPFQLGTTVTDENDGSYVGDFAGTITINGVEYPVTESGPFYTLHVAGRYVIDNNAKPSTLQSSDLDTTSFPACFVAGSIVTTDQGFRLIEDLRIGDNVITVNGVKSKILWVGIQVIDLRFGYPERLQPVRLLANTLDRNVPNKDLTLSNDHALLVDGVLATAGALVNETSVCRVPLSEFRDGKITYYHIETEEHEIILVNNTPAETFIDNVSRSSFDNYKEYIDLYGEEREMDELDLPRAMSPRQLPKSIKARLRDRAEMMGFEVKNIA